MQYIKSTEDGIELHAYLAYIRDCGPVLPPGAREFVMAPGRYDLQSPSCLHDSWVESISILEAGSGERRQNRVLQIEIVLLGAFHDGYHFLRYAGVRNYSALISKSVRGEAKIGHGDWMIDEVTMESEGLVKHAILFAETGSWEIVCDDIAYSWESKPAALHS